MKTEPKVLVILGSAADESYTTKCLEFLRAMEIPFLVRVASAHRSPDRLRSILKEYQSAKVILAFAGHAAHLAGVIASESILPVVAVPLPTSDLKGLDSLLSSVQMPGGIPVATMAIGEAGAQNAAIFAAEILSLSDQILVEKIRNFRKDLIKKVEKGSEEIEKKWH